MTAAAPIHLPRRDRTIVLGSMAAITGLAWAYVVWLAAAMDRMPMASGMGAVMQPAFRAWSAIDFILMFVMWAVMMIGMMAPSVTPMVLLYSAVGRRNANEGQRPFAATGWFGAGYVLAWAAFSLGATFAQWQLSRLALLTPMMESADDLFGGAVLVAAGLYQWSPLKEGCLRQCQSPLGFLMSRGGYRADAWGSLRLGAEHGAYCVGCCWALMALLFVGGVMNLLWIAGLTVLVLLEKIVPAGRLVPRLAGMAMVVTGLLLMLR